MLELHPNGKRWVHPVHMVQSLQAKVSTPYLVVVKTPRNTTIWCRVDAITPLEAVTKGESLASVFGGVMEDISYLDTPEEPN